MKQSLRIFKAAALGFSLLCATVFAADSQFEAATAKYKSGDFKTAADIYETMIQSHKESLAVYYNLANADFRLGKKGKALLAYERAIRISPRDPDARWNIAILKSALPDRIEKKDENFILAWVHGVNGHFTVNEISFFFTAVLALLAAFGFLDFIFPKIKPWTRPFRFLVVLLWLAAGVFFFFKWLEVKEPRIVVLDKEVSARSGPSNKETKSFVIHEGAEAKVIDQTPEWFYVALDNQLSGWLPKNSCEII